VKEVPFIGGNVNDATRVGDTVRRRAGPWTPAVHALLRFLENAGFEAPRARGMDEKGREILEYIEGDTHPGWPDPAPDWVMDDDHLAAGARLLRRYHDLVTGFEPPAGARWRFVAPTAHEIICHNDWAPWNALFRDRRLAVMRLGHGRSGDSRLGHREQRVFLGPAVLRPDGGSDRRAGAAPPSVL
jgi:hypothetical protein